MYPFVVTIVYPVRTAASQAAKTGSNPVGDAKLNEALAVCAASAFFFHAYCSYAKIENVKIQHVAFADN